MGFNLESGSLWVEPKERLGFLGKFAGRAQSLLRTKGYMLGFIIMGFIGFVGLTGIHRIKIVFVRFICLQVHGT